MEVLKKKLKPLESLWIDFIKISGASEILGSFLLGSTKPCTTGRKD